MGGGNLSSSGMGTFIGIFSLFYGFSFIITIALTVACGVIAKKRGRNAFGWAVAGFFFGLIALIVLLCMQPLHYNNPKVYNGNNYNSANTWICPNCQSSNTQDAQFCSKCGTQRDQDANEQVASTTANQDSEQNQWTCPQCGNKNDSAMSYCTKCYLTKPNDK